MTSLEAESSHEVSIDEEHCHKTKSVSLPPTPSAPLLAIAPTAPLAINHSSVPDVLDLFANDVNIVQGSSKEAICPISPLLEPLTPLAEDEDAMSVIQMDSQRDNGKAVEVDKDGKTVRAKDENGALTQDDNHLRKKEAKATIPVTSEKRKKDSMHNKVADGQVKKRQKTEAIEDASSSTTKHALSKSARSESIKKQGKRRKTLEYQDDADPTDLDLAPKAKKQKRMDDKTQAQKDSSSFSDPSLSTSLRTSQSKPKSTSTVHAESRSAADDPETREIVGMLIETMATSRASSLAVSSLYKSVMQSRPSLKTQRSEKEWMAVFKRVLNIFSGGGMGGVFGKVESSGKVCRLSSFIAHD